MSDLSQRIAGLSTNKLKLLLQQLKPEKEETLSQLQIKPQSRDFNCFPLSFPQKRLWFLSQLQPDDSSYNEFQALRLLGSLNITALQQSFNEIVRRHEVLRTKFAVVEEQPLQVIATTLNLTIPVIDLQEFPQDPREAEVLRLASESVQQPFDLAKEPLIRVSLLQLGKAEYVLLLIFHHIVFDQWTWGILIKELAVLYKAFSKDWPNLQHASLTLLPELPIQYADFAVWQQQWLQGGKLEAQLSYWKQQLNGAPAELNLPTDHPRPAVRSNQGAVQYLVMPKSLTKALKALSLQEDATLFMTLLAALNVLLYRYTQQEDILVGTTISGRNVAELEGLMGFFINIQVMRTDLSGNPPFRILLQQVRRVVLGAYEHQDLPFENLVDELKVKRDLSRNPLFQVALVIQHNALNSSLELPGLTLKPLEIHRKTAKFDLNLFMADIDQGLIASLEYSTELFNTATITRMLRHFQTLLEGIVANPDQQISDLPLLTEAEWHQMLVEWNDTQTDYPQERCIQELFEAQVERAPDAVAVAFEDEQLTYRALNARANQLAHHLQKLGVGPEVLVGICVERSLHMVIGLLGILKAGGAYVPLDPTYPQERLAFMLENSQPSVLLTQQHLVESLPTHTAKVVCLDSNWEPIAQEKIENPRSNITSEHLAYVIYTSGSTGRPKGAMNTHRGICNRLLWMQDAYQLTTADKVLQKTPFSFDVSVWEFFWPLMTGARLVVAQPDGHRDTNYLVNLITQQQISTLHFVPSMLQVFLEAENLETCKSLKRVIASGEALPAQLQKRFFNRLDAQLHNLYGPTEAAVDVTFWACVHQSSTLENSATAQKTVLIGHPIANTQIYLLDEYLNPVPVGVTGEVYIGGVGLGRGYLNNPELTAEKFIPNPFSHKSAERLYQTGDQARYLPNGEIEYIGRIDHQVKVRGFRIELGEIEALISQHPAVRETVVVVRSDEAASQRLVAYVVPHSEQTLTITELRRFLESKLPNYMVPAAFVMLEALPLTPNGKVDRKALPVPDLARPELEVVYQAPQTEVEQTIATIYQEVLQVKDVGIHDNFFELGGHSLLLLQVHSKLQKTFQRDFPLVEMFQYPTISHLARYLSQESSEQESFPQHSHRPESRIGSVQRRKQARKEHRAATKQKGVSSQ